MSSITKENKKSDCNRSLYCRQIGLSEANYQKNCNNFMSFQSVYNYDTRINENVVIPIYSLSLYERTPYYIDIKLHNKLLLNLRNKHIQKESKILNSGKCL